MLPEERRTQLDGIVQQMISNNEPDDAIQFVVNDFKGKYEAPAKQPSLMDRFRAKFNERLDNASKTYNNPNMTGYEKTIGNMGQGYGAVADIPMELIGTGIRAIPESLRNAVSEAPIPFLGGRSLKQVGQDLAPVTEATGQGYNKLEEVAPRVTNPLNAIGNMANLAGLMAGGVGNPKYSAGRLGASPTIAPVKNAAVAAKEAVFPVNTPQEALREVLQAYKGERNAATAAESLKSGEKALNYINPQPIKGTTTFQQIRQQLDNAIPTLAKKVDDELLKDTKLYKLDELSTKQPIKTDAVTQTPTTITTPPPPQWEAVKHPSGGGFAVINKTSGKYDMGQGGHPAFYGTQSQAESSAKYIMDKIAKESSNKILTATPEVTSVKVNFVDEALKNLSELYSEIGEKGLALDYKNMRKRAITEGLSKKEVNDIARTYNSEFGSKAFAANGNPLTSVNSQHYQTTQRGLKEVARRDMPPEVAATDALMHDIYKTRNLITQNEVAAARLRDKFNKRGVLEKAGKGVLILADLMTGGIVKGALRQIAPKNFGNFTKNAVEIEDALTKNLAILQKANNAKTPKETVNIIKNRNKKTPPYQALPITIDNYNQEEE